MDTKAQFQRIAGIVLMVVIASLSLLGCTPVAADTQTLSAERPLIAEVICPGAAGEDSTCYLVVSMGAFEQALKATLSVEATGGVRFDRAFGLLFVSSDGRSGATAPIDVPLMETRQLAIPLIAEPAQALSGGYLIFVRATGSELADQRFQTFAMVYVQVEAGSARIVTSPQILDAAYGIFVQGSGDLSYLVTIDAQDPTRGRLIVKVPSRYDSFQPEVIVTVRDGIAFEQSSTNLVIGAREVRQKLGVIHAGGYRIVSFPFTYVPGSLSGQRVITVGIREGEVVTRLEVAPITLVLQSDVISGAAQITTGRIAPVNLLGQPVANQEPAGDVRAGGISFQGAAQPVFPS